MKNFSQKLIAHLLSPVSVLILTGLAIGFEIYCWQMVSYSDRGLVHELNYQGYRLILTTSLSISAIFLLPNSLLAASIVITSISCFATAAYWNHFLAILTLGIIQSQSSEGAALGSDIFKLIPINISLIFLILLAVKGVLLRKLKSIAHYKDKYKKIGCTFLAIYICAFSWQFFFKNNPRELIIKLNAPRIVKNYGFTWLWISEALWLDREHILSKIDTSPLKDTISAIDGPIPGKMNLLLIQVESLDFGILGWENQEGREITPFLNSLRDTSHFYKIHASHTLGSANTDFCMLMQQPRSETIIPYKVDGFNFNTSTSLPAIAHNNGMTTHALHGYKGSFFNRRPNFVKMGFDSVEFYEDLEQIEGIEKFTFFKAEGILDKSVLNRATKYLTNHTNSFVFVITLTSHSPYTYLPDNEFAIYSHPSSLTERYVNSINYVDRSLRETIDRIPAGTTVIIYGDHYAHGNEFTKNSYPYVPAFIFTKGIPMPSQASRDNGLALSGSLRIEDLAGYISSFFLKRGEKAGTNSLLSHTSAHEK
jgi:glucan phosphoethanolaminetransferase (alkaline phosphatase superfamily)